MSDPSFGPIHFPRNSRPAQWLRLFAQVAAVLVMVLGLVVMLGWHQDVGGLKSIIPGLATEKPNTALSFLLAGAALLAVIRGGPWRGFGAAAGLAVAAFAAATLSQDLLGVDFGIDELLYADSDTTAGAPGRMSPATALAFVLSGAAIALFARPGHAAAAQLLALMAAGTGAVALAGYLLNVDGLYAVYPYASMALHTAFGLVLLGAGVLCASPREGLLRPLTNNSSGAIVARRLLALGFVVPLFLGVLFFAAARNVPFLSSTFVMAVALVASGVLLLGSVWWTAHIVEGKEREVVTQRNLLQTTLQSIGDGVIVTDAAGRITFMNGTAESLTGWSLHDATQRPLDEVFVVLDEATRERVEDTVARVARSNTVVTLAEHALLVDRKGVERPVDDSAAPVRSGDGMFGVVLVFRDDTERREREHLLRKSEQLFRETFEGAPLGIAHIGLDGEWLRFNSALCAMTGYSATDLRAVHFDDFTKSHGMIVNLSRLREDLHTGARRLSFDAWYVSPSGTGSWLHVNVVLQRDALGRPIYYLAVFEDITARRTVEIRLQKNTEALQRQDRRKDQFLATLGHELRNPLAALDTGIRLLRQDLGDPHSVQEMMDRQVEQLKVLVNDLLEVSRITRGKLSLRKSPLDLADVVRNAVRAVQGGIDDKRQRLDLLLPEPVWIDGDVVRLEQVAVNLVSNASRFTPPGGRIEVSIQAADGHAVLRVRDNGEGIRPARLEEIFEPFVQVGEGRGGLGIGLALVKGLVELHGGDISVHSDGEGTGSTFTVRLPNLRQAPGVAEREGPSATGFPAPVRVLVVDDLREAADGLGLLLGALGAEVRCAYTGRDALAVARAWSPDVALVDIGLPDIQGYDVARELRSEPGGEHLLLLAVTGFGDDRTADQAAEAGFDARLIKPADHMELRDRILAHLQPRLAG